MSQELIDIGLYANDPNADDLREGGGKINGNFDELYGLVRKVGFELSLGVTDAMLGGSTTYIAQRMNARTTTIGIKSTPVFVSIANVSAAPGGNAVKYVYLFKGGPGVWGVSGAPVTSLMFTFISSAYLTPADVESNRDAEIIPLGVLSPGQSFTDLANAATHDFNDSGVETETGVRQFYFTFTEEGKLKFALFTDTPGIYGLGSTPFTEVMFVVTTDDTIVPEKTKLSEFENDIKSVLSSSILSKAKRVGDILYGVLDQFTGESINLIKNTSSPEIDNIMFFQLGGETFKRIVYGAVNIKWWGAVGDDFTDNHDAIMGAVNYAVANMGGAIIIPDDGIYLTSPIVLPTVSIADSVIIPIEFIGQTAPSQLFGTVGTLPPFPRAGSVLKCLSTTPGTSVISTVADSGDPLGFSAIKIIIRDLEIRTYQNPHINAIDASNAIHFRAENVQVSTGVYSVDAVEPTHNTRGIITPKKDNGALTILRNVSVSGFEVGVVVNEHTYGDLLNITCNRYAFAFQAANHASIFGRVDIQRNTYAAIWEGPHTVHISQFNLEHAGAGQTNPSNAWQATVHDIVDPNFYGRGEIFWTSVTGGIGTDESLSMDGGDLIKFTNSHFYQVETQSGYRGGAFRVKAVNGTPVTEATASRPWEITNDKVSFGSMNIRVGTAKDAIDSNDFIDVISLFPDKKAKFYGEVSVEKATADDSAVRYDQVQTVIRHDETIDIPDLGSHASADSVPFTVTGAAVGDAVDVVPAASILTNPLLTALRITGYVSAANTVVVRGMNPTATSMVIPSSLYKIIIRK